MTYLIAFFIFDTLAYVLLKNTVPLDVLNIISIAIYTALLIYLFRKNTRSKHIFILLIAAYIIKIGFMYFDIYADGTFLLVNNRMDTTGFHRVAMEMFNQENFSFVAEKGNYPFILYIFYKIYGVNKVMAQFMNLIMFSLTQLCFLEIMRLFDMNDRKAFFPMLLTCIFPATYLFIPIMMREAPLILCLVSSIYFFIKWYKHGSWLNAALPVVFLLAAAVLHMGFLALIPVYLFAVLFYDREKGKLTVKLKTILAIVAILFAMAVIVVSFRGVFMRKLGGVAGDYTEWLYAYLEKTEGASAYLVDLEYDSLWDIMLHAPARVFYFLFSPLPWTWRGLMDVFTFLADSVFYIAFVIIVIPLYRKTEKQHRLLFWVFILQFLVFIVIFAHGTYTAGAAVRHRFKSVFIILTILIIPTQGVFRRLGSFFAKIFRVSEIPENEEREPLLIEVYFCRLLMKILTYPPFNRLTDERYTKLRYFIRTGKRLNLEDPKTYNEKIQWLKLNDRNPDYRDMTDKIGMRRYVTEKAGRDYTVPILGVWERFEDIDFDELPDKFVLKCNHDSGSTVVVADKSEMNRKKLARHFRRKLKTDHYIVTREYQYKGIRPKILCEELLDDGSEVGLRDYKVFCFNGQVEFIRVNYMGDKSVIKSEYDRDWNIIDDTMKYHPGKNGLKKPEKLREMIRVAEKFAEGLSHLRVDFYDVGDRLYIGELTFYHGSGMNWFRNTKTEHRLGELIDLSMVNKSERAGGCPNA